MPDPHRPAARRLLTAELLSIGSELTVGDTRDTNAGDLAHDLTERGVVVRRLTALPDELDTVRDAFAAGLERADLIVATGGLGPTPDDLTREAIAAVLGETPVVDPATERWLRDRFERRGTPFPEANVKQAWLIPSGEAMRNPHGTAPGWFVRARDRVIVALPGPPREMRPMWADEALPRLEAIGLGTDVVARTYRLHGIGESHVAELLGDALLRDRDPEVATYARVEAVDVRVSSHGPGAAERVARAAAIVEERLGQYVWATGNTTWADAIAAALATRGWTLAIAESGTGAALTQLLGGVPGVVHAEAHADTHAAAGAAGAGGGADLEAEAVALRERTGASVGLALAIRPRGDDTAVSVAVATPNGVRHERRLAFLGGSIGAARAALSAAAVLLGAIRGEGDRG